MSHDERKFDMAHAQIYKANSTRSVTGIPVVARCERRLHSGMSKADMKMQCLGFACNQDLRETRGSERSRDM